MLTPPLALAEVGRQAAGACEAYAPALEDPSLRWDYWWSGRCVGGLASGPGYLLQYMKGGGFGDVYAASMEEGRAQGEVHAYGPAFLGAEWSVRAGTAAEGDDWPETWRPLDEHVPRFSLPAALQEALNRFARDVGHRQMPALPVVSGGERCRPVVEVETRPGGPAHTLDVAAFIRSHPDYATARRDALLQAMAMHGEGGASEEQRLLARARLALATAVVGCRSLVPMPRG